MDYGYKERAKSKEQVTQGHNIVADGWAGAANHTDGQTDGWTDGQSLFRVACPQLKINQGKKQWRIKTTTMENKAGYTVGQGQGPYCEKRSQFRNVWDRRTDQYVESDYFNFFSLPCSIAHSVDLREFS